MQKFSVHFALFLSVVAYVAMEICNILKGPARVRFPDNASLFFFIEEKTLLLVDDKSLELFMIIFYEYKHKFTNYYHILIISNFVF